MEEHNPDTAIRSQVETRQEESIAPKKEKKPFNIDTIKSFYASNYKKLFLIPVILLLLAMLQIGIQTATTGEFINKDVSLKGGLTITILTDKDIDLAVLEQALSSDLPQKDISARLLKGAAKTTGIIVTADIESEQSEMDLLLSSLEKNLGIKLTKDIYTIEIMGSSLGASFFKETFRALYIAFLFMGMVVFLYFGTSWKYKTISIILTLVAAFSLLKGNNIVLDIIAYLIGIALITIYIINSIPSIAVILAAFADIIITVAIVNLIGMKLSTAGIAAFLMLIGYSVDTDILLSTRMLKRKEGTMIDRMFGAMKTGLMMSITTLVAVIIALVLAESEVISQIMTIILIGLIVDLINTWLQNAGILAYYMEKKKHNIK